MSSRFGSRTDGGIIRNFIESYDGDAANYFRVNTAITSDADKNAINTFYLGLKSDGIYTKMKAMYLPIWGSSATSKWNLVNPLDTNAAYRLTFATGYTFTSGGMQGNGTSAFANTFVLPSAMTQNSAHLSLYARTNSTGIWMGSDNPFRFWFTPNLDNIDGSTAINEGAPDPSNTYARSLLTSHWIATRTAATTTKTFNKTTLINTNTLLARGQNSKNVYLSSRNNNGIADFFTNIQFSFASIGTGLTDTESSNFYTRVNTLMTYFGINV